MTDAELQPLLLPRPLSIPTRRLHVLGEAMTIPAEISISGHEQAEKTCKLCGAVRITVLAPAERGGIRRAWRARADECQIDHEPPCIPLVQETA